MEHGEKGYVCVCGGGGGGGGRGEGGGERQWSRACEKQGADYFVLKCPIKD